MYCGRKVPEFPWETVSAREGLYVLIAALYFVAGWRSAIRSLRARGLVIDATAPGDAHSRLVRARHEHQAAAAALAAEEG